ncbi:MAG TPA: C40 family peptidase [Bacteroidia bacterium]
MQFGICNLSIVPCRKEPSDRSEMVTQLLFGDHFEILEIIGNWCRIRNAYDSYECWIDKKQFQPIQQHTFDIINSTEIFSANELVQVVTHNNSKQLFPITIASSLPNFDNGECAVENHSYLYDGAYISGHLPFSKGGIMEIAMMYLNAPYLWGGKTPFGIDCSGFTQMVYKINGVKLKRDAYQQAEQGETLSFVEEAEAGDLAFFDNDEGRIIHVGIVMDNNKIIHASGKVRIDGFDHHGIFNNEKKDYSHRLRLLKRVV